MCLTIDIVTIVEIKLLITLVTKDKNNNLMNCYILQHMIKWQMSLWVLWQSDGYILFLILWHFVD